MSFAANQNRIVVPSIFQNLLIKIAQPSLVLLYFYGVIKFAEIFKGLALTLFLMVAGLVGYVFFLRKRSFSPKILRGGILTKSLGFEMLRFSSFNLLVVLGGLFAQRVDQLLIVPLLGYEKLAIFSFGFFIAEAIDVPRKALSSIAQPLLSTSILEKNWAHVAEIYRKTALLQVVVGVFMLAGIWACADALFDLMPKNGAAFRTGKWVILILGLSRLADMATGTNAEIITLSDYYRFNFRSFLTMALLNIVLNLLLIPRFGIEGSAVATLISIATVNVWRLFFIKKKFNMQPLDWKMVAVVGFGLAAWFITDLTPSVSQPILTILLKGLIISVLYGFLILYFKISPEVNAAFNKVKTTIFK